MFTRVRLLSILSIALFNLACPGCPGPGVDMTPPEDAGSGGGGGSADGGGGDTDGGDSTDAGTDGGHASPDELVAYFSDESIDGGMAPSATTNIWLRKADGTSPVAVTALANASSLYPFFNPDRTELVYISDQVPTEPLLDASGTFFANVWRHTAEGNTPVTRFTSARARFARWTHQERIVFGGLVALDGSDALGPTNLWIVKPDGTELSPITTLETKVVDTYSFAVDESAVYYASERDLETGEPVASLSFNIWRAPLSGGPHVGLTRNLIATSNHPRLSPDSSQIAFLSDRVTDRDVDEGQSAMNVWLMNADGSNARPLTTYRWSSVLAPPQWADDGASIVFAANSDSSGMDSGGGKTNLFKLDVASGAITSLGFNAGNDSAYPMVLTTGAHVVFQSSRPLDDGEGLGPVENLWLVDTDGAGLAPLTLSEVAHSRTAANTD